MIECYTKEQWENEWSLPCERWRSISRFLTRYPYREIEVSSYGRLRKTYIKMDGTIVRKIMYQAYNKSGYLMVAIDRKRYRVHRLVLEAFKPIKNQSSFDTDHINGTRDDNNIINLRWCTRKENNNNPITLQRRNESCGIKIQAVRVRDGLVMWEWPTINAAAKRFNIHKATVRRVLGNREFCDKHTYPGCYLRLAP